MTWSNEKRAGAPDEEAVDIGEKTSIDRTDPNEASLKESTEDEPTTNFLRLRRSADRLFPGDEGFNENNSPVEFVINEWALGTSIHGVPYVTDSTQWHLWKRMVWVVLVLISSGFMLWQITQLIRQYLDYDVITDTQTINAGALDFPEVIICNANPISAERRNATGIIDPRNESELEQVSVPLQEFIAATWFNLVLLNVSDVWTPTYVPELGRCWSFKTEKSIKRPGFYGGLKVYMDLQQPDFVEGSDFAAAFVWVNTPGSAVNIYEPPAVVGPGRESFLVMDLTEFTRERQLPWARCATEQEENPLYSQFQCRSECAYAFIRNECGCRVYGDMTDLSLNFCAANGAESICIDEIYSNETVVVENCDSDCSLPSCFEQTFRTSTVVTDFSLRLIDDLSDTFGVTKQYVRENYISLTINFRTLEYSLLTESKGLSLNQLLGAIGGSMGFFLGISLVSVFELFGDLVAMRLIPRFFGNRHLHGLGSRFKED